MGGYSRKEKHAKRQWKHQIILKINLVIITFEWHVKI